MKKILITGAGGSAGINFIKSLRMAPEKMFIVGSDSNKWHLEVSKELDAKCVLPHCNRSEYIEKLNLLIEKYGIELIHPQPDVEVYVISENREKINAKCFLPSKKTIRICQNKMELNKVLNKANVPVPKSYLIKQREDIEKRLPEVLERYPHKAWLRAIRGAGSRASLPINEISHAEMWIDYWSKNKGIGYGEFMLCEYLPGKEFAWQSVWKDGELVVSQARERLEYLFGYLTPSGQTSTPAVARTVNRDDINEVATKAVKAVDSRASGVFCIDLKENINGVPCVTEINAGRFFTTSNFFSEAGVNMPYIYVKLAYGENIPSVKKYNPLPENLYWIRVMDAGHKLVRGCKWESEYI